MRKLVACLALAGVTLSAICSGSAFAEDRAEAVSNVRMFSATDCPITPNKALAGEQGATTEFLPMLLATFLAGIGGQLATAGLNAAGDALEQASKEKGIVAEGTTSFYMSHLMLADGHSKVAHVEPQPICLVLFSEGKADLSGLADEQAMKVIRDVAAKSGLPAIGLFGDDENREAFLANLRRHGINHIPSVYAEVRILSTSEGLYLRPVLVWYRDRMSGAPSGTTTSEFHLTLATPGAGTGAGDIGAVFAGARMILPKIQPGQILAWPELKTATSVMVPLRPSAGFVDTRLAAVNTLYTQLATRNRELVVAQRAFDAAQRKDKANSTADTREAMRTTWEVLADATEEQKIAEGQVKSLQGISVGATNAKGRFVVVRDANQFGLALAKALKAQADATGKAVTTALTPSPSWSANDTTYVTARSELDAAQRDYDAAVASSDSAAIAKAGDALILKKAKLNEAAAALNRPLPYPQLLH